MNQVAAEQGEFFQYPVLENAAPKRSLAREYLDATEEHGPLLTPTLAAGILALHRSRIHQLMDAGRIPTVNLRGRKWIPAVALEMFATEDRPTGRPPTVREQFVAAYADRRSANADRRAERKAKK